MLSSLIIQTNSKLFEGVEIIGPDWSMLEQVIKCLQINTKKHIQEVGRISSETHFLIEDKNNSEFPNNEQQIKRASKLQAVFPEGVPYTLIVSDAEEKISHDILSRMKICTKRGSNNKQDLNSKREGLFFANFMQEIEEQSFHEQAIIVGQKKEEFIIKEFDNDSWNENINDLLQIQNMNKSEFFPSTGEKQLSLFRTFESENIDLSLTSSSSHSKSKLTKIRIIIFFEVAFIIQSCLKYLSVCSSLINDIQIYLSQKRNYFVSEKSIPYCDYISYLSFINKHKAFQDDLINLSRISFDQEFKKTNLIKSSGISDFQMKPILLNKNIETNFIPGWINILLFKHVKLESLLKIINAVLTEKKVIIFSQNITYLTSVMISLQKILFIFLKLIPHFYYSMQFSEVISLMKFPFLVGVNSNIQKIQKEYKCIHEYMENHKLVLFDLDFQNFIGDKEILDQINYNSDFVSKKNKKELQELFNVISPPPKKKGFLSKVLNIFSSEERNLEKMNDELSSYSITFEFNTQDFDTANKICLLFHKILLNDVLSIQDDEANILLMDETLSEFSQKNQIKVLEDYQGSSSQNQEKIRSKFQRSFTGSTIYQKIQKNTLSSLILRNVPTEAHSISQMN